jgi:hypothetical protein
MPAKTHSGGYETRPWAKNRHFSRINSVQEGEEGNLGGEGEWRGKVLRGKIWLGSQGDRTWKPDP